MNGNGIYNFICKSFTPELNAFGAMVLQQNITKTDGISPLNFDAVHDTMEYVANISSDFYTTNCEIKSQNVYSCGNQMDGICVMICEKRYMEMRIFETKNSFVQGFYFDRASFCISSAGDYRRACSETDWGRVTFCYKIA